MYEIQEVTEKAQWSKLNTVVRIQTWESDWHSPAWTECRVDTRRQRQPNTRDTYTHTYAWAKRQRSGRPPPETVTSNQIPIECHTLSYLTITALCLKVKVKVLYRSHTVFSAFNPSLRSSEQPPCSAQGPAPDSEPVPRSRVLTGDTPNMHVLTVGETRAPGGNPHKHGENMQTSHSKALPQPGIKPRTFWLRGHSANH